LRVTEPDSPMRNAMLVTPASVQLRGSLRRQVGIPPTQFGRTVARIAACCGLPQPVASRLRDERSRIRGPLPCVMQRDTFNFVSVQEPCAC
jgi:hypothetical protein